jgi:hypothetical protein
VKRLVRGWLLSSITILAACVGDDGLVEPTASDVLTHDDLLVPIPRNLGVEEVAERSMQMARAGVRIAPQQGNGDFYLAIRKSALQERWIWSVYLKEVHPFGPAPMTLGTKLVRFRVQNDKLFVFDADERRATSDIFSPDLIIDAFPLVLSTHFHALPGSGNYYLIDPADGQNRFSALADYLAGGFAPIKLETELSFVHAFKKWNDGGAFEQIITTYADQPIGGWGDVEANDYRLAATLGVNLRRHAPTAGFAPVEAPWNDHYFLTDPINVKNTGGVKQLAVKWGFSPGMQPVKWVVGPAINQLAQDPSLGGADLYAAIKRGVESWNDVFGYPVFTVSLAKPSDSFADDHVNYVIVDPDVSKSYAYADWRHDPETGEIRGASVYFGGGFFFPFPDDPENAPNGLRKPGSKQKPKAPGLVWKDQHANEPCVIVPPEKALTGAEKLEAYIQWVTTHEVGHTLGLRHNFKGSLVPPYGSSVMEYSDADAAIAQPTPGIYDQEAIDYLYGMSPELPAQPFCTDDATLYDPNCVRFDPPTATPLADYQIPFYEFLTGLIFDGSIPGEWAELYLSFFATELVGYARTGTPDEAADAWAALRAGVVPPIVDPAQAAGVDAVSAWLYRETFLQPTGAIAYPVTDAAILATAASDGKNIILDSDGARSFATRRTVIDALKAAQNLDSYLALLSARDTLQSQLAWLPPAERALTTDLIARIDAVTRPYFQ